MRLTLPLECVELFVTASEMEALEPVRVQFDVD